MVGEILAIGNDLFPESVLALRRGIVNNLVYKDPFGMAQAALKRLLDFVLLGERPQSDVERGMVELVFRSNLDRSQLRRTFRLRVGKHRRFGLWLMAYRCRGRRYLVAPFLLPHITSGGDMPAGWTLRAAKYTRC